MKKNTAAVLIFGLLFMACEKNVKTTIEENGDRTTVETVGLDRDRIDSTTSKVGEKIEVVAEETGEALKTAGEDVKREIDKADRKIKIQTKTRQTETERK